MITKATKLEIPENCLKSKILAIRKAKKIFQDEKKREKKVLVDIYFNKIIVLILIIDLRIYI